ncbi:hypothetical protein PQO01_07645 [Lentisphaera marina]|uniref:hypothetical protein n=1 Tax=Lentisphaera marina TaxID=1111041 RepID=UPI002366AE1F|nr:hypothetical protein [Lentisphaera marina]MDD7984818.1 hypothetical protein [Lentisphaera marina]
MNKISEWYPFLGHLTFPTVFLALNKEECTALQAGQSLASLEERITRAIASLPGSCVLGVDSCMPTDSTSFKKSKALKSGKLAFKMLAESEKVKAAIAAGDKTLTVRPYRRMDKTREFRLFVKDGDLKAMTQRNLERHFKRLEARQDLYWQKGLDFVDEIKKYINEQDYVVDIYFTSTADVMIVDFNTWGEPTLPLLMKTWDRDWSQVDGLKLMAEPIQLGGDIKVSF